MDKEEEEEREGGKEIMKKHRNTSRETDLKRVIQEPIGVLRPTSYVYICIEIQVIEKEERGKKEGNHHGTTMS